MSQTKNKEEEATLDQYQMLLDLAPDGIFVADSDGRYTFVNAAGCRLLGYSREELMRMTIRDLIPAEDLDRLLETKARLMRGETGVDEWRLRRKDGTWVPVEVSANFLPEGLWQGFVRDISDRKALEAEREAVLEHSEAHGRWLQAVVDTLPLGVLLFHPDGHVTHNRRAEEIMGIDLKPEVGTAQYAGRIYYTDGRQVPREELVSQRVLRNGETVTAQEYLVEQPDGTRIPVLGSAGPIRDDGGRIIGAVGVFQDMTERMRMEEAIRTNERLMQTIFDLLPVGIWVADGDGRIVRANPAGARIWGGARYVGMDGYHEYKGWWIETGEPLTAEDWGLARAVRFGETSRGELIRIQCFDGSYKTIINWAAPLREDSGAIVGAIAVNEDVTSLQRTQEQLHQAVRDREKILAVVAHDLRNPLHRIMLGASAAAVRAGELPGGEPVRALAASLIEISGRMSGLVDDLLAVAVEAAGQASLLKRAPVPAETLLARAAEAARPLLSKAGLELEVEIPRSLPVLHIDEARILRVFSNLFDNAMKFTPPPGRIRVAAQRVPGGVRFSVGNTGRGLRADELAGMFQPFWQAVNDGQGAGLGLSICRSIVEAHAGAIWAEPAEGERVRVSFVLPCKAGEVRRLKEQTPDEGQTASAAGP
jgi:PAS domain S-box-containing protein